MNISQISFLVNILAKRVLDWVIVALLSAKNAGKVRKNLGITSYQNLYKLSVSRYLPSFEIDRFAQANIIIEVVL